MTSASATISVPNLPLAPAVSVEKEEALETREGVERADGEENVEEEKNVVLFVFAEALVIAEVVAGCRGGVVGSGGGDDDGGGGNKGSIVVFVAIADLIGALVSDIPSEKAIFVVGVVGLEGRERRSHMFRRCDRDADTTLCADRGAEVPVLSGS